MKNMQNVIPILINKEKICWLTSIRSEKKCYLHIKNIRLINHEHFDATEKVKVFGK